MKKTFRPYNQKQLMLFPPSVEEWVPENHLARFVNETVEANGPVGDPEGVRTGISRISRATLAGYLANTRT